MFKSAGVFLGFYMVSISCFAGALPLNCQTSTATEENLDALEDVASKVDDCPRPKDGKFLNICTLVENQDYQYKKELLAMSCADSKKDSKETINSKVNYMWEKYYGEFGCEGQSFTPEKNVLKYSINQGFNYFVDGVVKEFDLNINLKDPSDGKTLLDFALEEKSKLIESYSRRPATTISQHEKEKLKELEDFCVHLKTDLKAKQSHEL